MLARGGNDPRRVAGDIGAEMSAFGGFPGSENVRFGCHGLQALDRVSLRLSRQNTQLVIKAGIANGQADEKAVELGFGQGMGAGHVDRVLRGQHHESLG